MGALARPEQRRGWAAVPPAGVESHLLGGKLLEIGAGAAGSREGRASGATHGWPAP